jgi:Mn2+/Fe2+ NRAMP family transporter
MLVATHKKSIMSGYHHPVWMRLLGWMVVAVITWMSIAMLVV